MITEKEILHIAKLARISFKKEELKKFHQEFSKILNYIEKLKEVDISEVEADFQKSFLKNVMRKDEREEKFKLEIAKKLIGAMPETQNNYLKVKKII
jgi:aspartyl-tRNA(Asn)/glutamyl-tRNA(Gln) amidotransferase subunit C